MSERHSSLYWMVLRIESLPLNMYYNRTLDPKIDSIKAMHYLFRRIETRPTGHFVITPGNHLQVVETKDALFSGIGNDMTCTYRGRNTPCKHERFSTKLLICANSQKDK